MLALPALLAAAPALAQPMPLTPSHPADRPPAIEAAPAPPSGPAALPMLDPALPPVSNPALPPVSNPALPPGPATRPGRFVVEELKAPDIDAVGVLDDRQGGFAATLWQGSPAVVVRRFLPQLAVSGGSRVQRSLARRLLLTAAPPPEGNAGQTPLLVELRAERLFAMGEAEGLASLLKSVPATLSSPVLSRLRVEAHLLAGDAKAACAEAAAHPPAGDPRLGIFCQLSAGKTLEANMALDLLRERKDADQAFIAAAEAMAGTPPARIERLPQPTPLHLAAFKAAGMALPADIVETAPPMMLRALSEATVLPVEVRLAAAERAEALGVIDTDALRRFHAAITLGPAEHQAAQAQGDRSPLGRTLLLRLAQTEPTAAARAALLGRILGGAAERGGFATAARLHAPLIADLKPVPELTPFAPLLARALYAAGRPEAAGTWVALAKADPATAKAADDLWVLARLYRSPGGAANPALYTAWREGRQLPPDQAERRAAVALELLQAMGERIPAEEWLALSPLAAVAETGPRPAVKALLRAAAEGGRLGEIVLLSLVALGESGLDKTDPDTLNRVVAALRSAGLEREARDLAVEAALANGI